MSNTQRHPASPARILHSHPEAADLLGGIDRTTVWRLVRAGRLDQVKIGRRAFITRESIDRFVETALRRDDEAQGEYVA